MHLVEFPYLKVGGEEIEHQELRPTKKHAVRVQYEEETPDKENANEDIGGTVGDTDFDININERLTQTTNPAPKAKFKSFPVVSSFP